jgi:dephospho-CoA kinase
MGKSTAAQRFRERGVPVCDADALVHALYEGDAVAPIEAAFPGTTIDGKVDRQKLSAVLLADPSGFKRLEAIVHPLVQKAERECLGLASSRGAKVAVLEIPLLLETGGDAKCDAVAVVSAPADLQRARVLARPGMTPEKLDAILARQMPDAEKRAKADFIVDTGSTIEHTIAQVDTIIDIVESRSGTAFERHWR